MPKNQRHSEATPQMIADTNSSSFHRLTQRYQGGKDGQPPSEKERTAIIEKQSKGKTSNAGSREAKAARAAIASAKMKPRSTADENDLCSEDDCLSSDDDSSASAFMAHAQPTCFGCDNCSDDITQMADQL